MVRRGREKEDESDGRADERREIDVALGSGEIVELGS